MTRLGRLFLAPLALALSMTVTVPASAGEAQDYMRAKHTELTTVLKQPASPARATRMSALLENMIDFEKLTRESLGNNYETLSADEVAELRAVLEKLVKKNYQKNIEKTLNYDVSYVAEEPGSDGVLVKTRVQSRNNSANQETISLDYRMHKSNGRWMIYDIITENSSMVRNYRNQFNKIIKRDGFRELIRKLNNKANEP